MRVIAQPYQHQDAVIEADTEALCALVAALRSARAVRTSHCGPFDSDERRFEVSILVDNSLINSRRWSRAILPYTDPDEASERAETRSLAPHEHARMVLAGEGAGTPLTVGGVFSLLSFVGIARGFNLNLHGPGRDDGVAWIVTNDPGCQELVRTVERAVEGGMAKSCFESGERSPAWLFFEDSRTKAEYRFLAWIPEKGEVVEVRNLWRPDRLAP